MKIKNATPLSLIAFQSVDLAGTPFEVVAMKGTFEIVKDAPLRLADAQEPIRTSDVLWEREVPSSLRAEDDLAPFKPATDVIVNATAHAPGGKSAAQWHAGVKVGALRKRVLVTGPRAWVHAPLLGWSMSPIVPVRAVPIRYERAFGGETYEKNPVGVGMVDVRRVDRSSDVPVPQILPADGRVPVLGEPYPVEGLGAIAKPWQPRRARAGTFDDALKAQERPTLPPDFNVAYWNAAHPDLICDGFLRGDEAVELENLHPEHARLAFTLPALVVAAAIVDRDGYRYGSIARLDTLLIDAERMRAEITWRATLPLYKHGIARIDAGVRAMLPGAA
ncbi:DUF2169 family type VI secretion system accessory protein [Polyangium aurulentum]|uniref:DUF2169 family type VI secretion system accessory protein n=1 Tax=Polyangium aurulentum TaxID=2567896 RepID=UPI0010ADEEF1|nr:DUF2169 domain-containing protein [Polyangium aurulentum]UQA55738.1 DUF2169 domain-containing protein [Polyangium aurulentum]